LHQSNACKAAELNRLFTPAPSRALDATGIDTDTVARLAPSPQTEDAMAINTQKVVIGGIAAGVVMNVIDFISYSYILGARMKAESDAFKPGMADSMMTSSAMITNIVMDFVLGIALVWTYAAIRPRFGPGPKTAVYAAFLFWVLAAIFLSGYMHMGMMSSGLWWSFAFVGLVNFLVSSWVGAKVYTEDAVA
jgi:hypothetical protein